MAAFNKKLNQENANIRNRSTEFANVSLFLKEFKIGARPFLTQLRGDQVHVRLMKLLMQIKKLDAGSRPGFATVYNGLQTEKGKVLLHNFVFNKEARISTQLGNSIIDFETLSISWKAVDPQFLKFPPLGTHCDLSFLLLAYDPSREIFTTHHSDTFRFAKDAVPFDVTLRINESVPTADNFLYIFIGGMKFVELWHDAEYNCEGRAGFGMEVLGVMTEN